MGDLERDTAVTEAGERGSYTANLSRDWEIWGPNGGYMAAVALRAAGAFTDLTRPATFSCLFLGVGQFDEVQIDVQSIRRAKRAEALRVCIRQDGATLLEAHVWAVAEGLAGLEHNVTSFPDDVPMPDELKSIAELMAGEERPGRFWRNFDQKPLSWTPPEQWPPPPPIEPRMQQWFKFAPTATFHDPWVDACRTIVMLDTWQWPAASRAHVHRGPEEQPYIAPSMNLAAHFHHPAPASEWLFVDARGPIAEGGLMAGEAALWSDDRQLVATGSSQMLCRPVPRGTPGSGTPPPRKD
jgi:acyl-CoA thioesterase-2